MGSRYSLQFCSSSTGRAGDYHEKTHPHYPTQKRRAAKRRKAKEAAQTEQQTQQQNWDSPATGTTGLSDLTA